MRRESRGEERLVSHCGDGDVVDVGEGDGGGFGEEQGGKEAGNLGNNVLGTNLQLCRKGLFRTCRVRPSYTTCPGGASMCGMATCLTSSCNRAIDMALCGCVTGN